MPDPTALRVPETVLPVLRPAREPHRLKKTRRDKCRTGNLLISAICGTLTYLTLMLTGVPGTRLLTLCSVAPGGTSRTICRTDPSAMRTVT